MEKRKSFNITGLCVPELHYMVRIDGKLDRIIQDYIERGAYFTINRACQYGKTTTLRLLEHRLESRYIVIRISFEGKEEYFASLQSMAGGLCHSMRKMLAYKQPGLAEVFKQPVDQQYPLQDFSERISDLCIKAGLPVIFMIDEVDKAADNNTFLSLLGMLREMYLARIDYGAPAFHNVILVGVHDIKNLKIKLRPEEEHFYNSPWNISTTFDVDMNFSPGEIGTMLVDYERDCDTGMNIEEMSAALHSYTGGYPFLVSSLCKKLAESGDAWTVRTLRNAVRDLLKEKNTLFDDVIKNIKNHKEFARLIEQVLVCGAQVAFEIQNPLINLGVMYGILCERDGKVAVSNQIFETLIFNYFISVRGTYALASTRYTDKNLYVHEGHSAVFKFSQTDY